MEFLKIKAKASTATQAQSASQQRNKQPSINESFELLQPIRRVQEMESTCEFSVSVHSKRYDAIQYCYECWLSKIAHTFEP